MRSSFVRTLTRPRPERLGGRARGSSGGRRRAKVASLKGKVRSAAALHRSSSQTDAIAPVAASTIEVAFSQRPSPSKKRHLQFPLACRAVALNIVKAFVVLVFPVVVFFAFANRQAAHSGRDLALKNVSPTDAKPLNTRL